MITFRQLQKFSLSFPETSEHPHFEKPSFKVKNKIFVTYDSKNKIACLKLSQADQDLFSLYDRSTVYPVPNKWGKLGWTLFEMSKVNKELFLQALTAAFCEVAPKKLAQTIRSKSSD